MTKFKPILSLSPASTRDACQAAFDELQDADKKAAKELLKGRLKEIERLRGLLDRAEKDLEKLLQKDVSEIAALQGSGLGESYGKASLSGDGWATVKIIR